MPIARSGRGRWFDHHHQHHLHRHHKACLLRRCLLRRFDYHDLSLRPALLCARDFFWAAFTFCQKVLFCSLVCFYSFVFYLIFSWLLKKKSDQYPGRGQDAKCKDKLIAKQYEQIIEQTKGWRKVSFLFSPTSNVMNISAKKAHFMLMKWLPGITLCPRILPESTQGNHFWTKFSTARETYSHFQDFRKTANLV